MRILGVIASNRKLGNTELLVSQVLRAATQFPGAEKPEIRLIRLPELRLANCTGCMRCSFEEDGSCPLDDDMEFLLSEFAAADALVFGSPVYTLLPPGPVKQIADRLLMSLARQRPAERPKPAVTVTLAGLPRWSELAVPFLNGLVRAFGFTLVDSLLAYAAGPGEVLLRPEDLTRAEAAGTTLAQGLTQSDMLPKFGAGRCPICGADFFRMIPAGIECPVCLAQGTLVDGVPTFGPSPSHRWEPEALAHHFRDWIQETGPRYMELRPEIRRVQKAFREAVGTWVKPPVG